MSFLSVCPPSGSTHRCLNVLHFGSLVSHDQCPYLTLYRYFFQVPCYRPCLIASSVCFGSRSCDSLYSSCLGISFFVRSSTTIGSLRVHTHFLTFPFQYHTKSFLLTLFQGGGYIDDSLPSYTGFEWPHLRSPVRFRHSLYVCYENNDLTVVWSVYGFPRVG